jgi:prophage regulatory protein
MRVLGDEGLREKGILFSRQHRHRLVKAGKFPAPIKVGANTNVWVEAEIDQYLKACIAKRDAQRRTQSAA